MKKIFSLLFATIVCVAIFAQTPTIMNYQVMVLDPMTGIIKSNKEVNVKIELRKGSATGTSVWSQEFNTTTSKSGICTLAIDFAGFDWNGGPYYISAIIDGKECGASIINSVPYAMQAANLDGMITREKLIGTWSVTVHYDYGDYTLKYTFNADGTGKETLYSTDGSVQVSPFDYYFSKAGVVALDVTTKYGKEMRMMNIIVVSDDKILMGNDSNGKFYTKETEQ